jgi:hypothetical protein
MARMVVMIIWRFCLSAVPPAPAAQRVDGAAVLQSGLDCARGMDVMVGCCRQMIRKSRQPAWWPDAVALPSCKLPAQLHQMPAAHAELAHTAQVACAGQQRRRHPHGNRVCHRRPRRWQGASQPVVVKFPAFSQGGRTEHRAGVTEGHSRCMGACPPMIGVIISMMMWRACLRLNVANTSCKARGWSCCAAVRA